MEGTLDFSAHLPMVQRLARSVARTLGCPTGVDTDDLVSSGLLGLAEAWERYDPSTEVPFEAYAVLRVRGAIVDSIRKADWVPRKIRLRVRRIAEARAALRNELGRQPTDAEIADRLGSQKIPSGMPVVNLVSLEQLTSDEDSRSADDLVYDPDAVVPGDSVASAPIGLPDALTDLDERDRLVVTLHYFEGLPFKKVAEILGITESRVSQLHMRALSRLKAKMEVA